MVDMVHMGDHFPSGRNARVHIFHLLFFPAEPIMYTHVLHVHPEHFTRVYMVGQNPATTK
jgi:hypothetical protein